MTPSVKLVAAANQTDQTEQTGQCRDPRQTWPPRIAGDSTVMTLAGSFAQGPEQRRECSVDLYFRSGVITDQGRAADMQYSNVLLNPAQNGCYWADFSDPWSAIGSCQEYS